MKTIKSKWCWLAIEVKGGWKLRLCIGKYDLVVKPAKVFKTVKAVEKFANVFIPSEGKIVFVHLKKCKCKNK